MPVAVALASLRICAGSHGPSLLENAISTKRTGSYVRMAKGRFFDVKSFGFINGKTDKLENVC